MHDGLGQRLVHLFRHLEVLVPAMGGFKGSLREAFERKEDEGSGSSGQQQSSQSSEGSCTALRICVDACQRVQACAPRTTAHV